MGNTAYKRRHRKLGLCTQCSRPAIPFSTYCLVHTNSHNKSNKKYFSGIDPAVKKKRRKERYFDCVRRGLCISCNNVLDNPDRRTCCNCSQRVQYLAYNRPLMGSEV